MSALERSPLYSGVRFERGDCNSILKSVSVPFQIKITIMIIVHLLQRNGIDTV